MSNPINLPEEQSSERSPLWMATFADMSTLLLTLFVLLLSFANMDIVKFRDMLGSVREAFGFQTKAFGTSNPTALVTKTVVVTAASKQGSSKSHAMVQAELKNIIESHGVPQNVEVEATPRGVIIRVRNQLMFRPGSAKLRPAAAPLLDTMVELVHRFPYKILIEGHTDDTPIRTRRFPSNWELSGARAMAVLRYLIGNGNVAPERLGAAGYADTRPLVPNDSAANRARNRRVEFVCYEEVTGIDSLTPPQRGP